MLQPTMTKDRLERIQQSLLLFSKKLADQFEFILEELQDAGDLNTLGIQIGETITKENFSNFIKEFNRFKLAISKSQNANKDEIIVNRIVTLLIKWSSKNPGLTLIEGTPFPTNKDQAGLENLKKLAKEIMSPTNNASLDPFLKALGEESSAEDIMRADSPEKLIRPVTTLPVQESKSSSQTSKKDKNNPEGNNKSSTPGPVESKENGNSCSCKHQNLKTKNSDVAQVLQSLKTSQNSLTEVATQPKVADQNVPKEKKPADTKPSRSEPVQENQRTSVPASGSRPSNYPAEIKQAPAASKSGRSCACLRSIFSFLARHPFITFTALASIAVVIAVFTLPDFTNFVGTIGSNLSQNAFSPNSVEAITTGTSTIIGTLGLAALGLFGIKKCSSPQPLMTPNPTPLS